MMVDIIALIERLHHSSLAEAGVSVELTYYGDAWSLSWTGCNGQDYIRGTLQECCDYAEKALDAIGNDPDPL